MAELDSQSRVQIERYIGLLDKTKYGGLICYSAILAAVFFYDLPAVAVVVSLFLGLVLTFSPFFLLSSSYRKWYQNSVLENLFRISLKSNDESELEVIKIINSSKLFVEIDHIHTETSFYAYISSTQLYCSNLKCFHHLRRTVNGKPLKEERSNCIFDGVVISGKLPTKRSTDCMIVSAELFERQFPIVNLLLNRDIKEQGILATEFGGAFYFYSERRLPVDLEAIGNAIDLDVINSLGRVFAFSQKGQIFLFAFPGAEHFLPPEKIGDVAQQLESDKQLVIATVSSLNPGMGLTT